MATPALTAPKFKYSKEKIEAALKKKGYQWFEDKLNIVGVRNSDTGKVVTNAFDDKITVSKKKSLALSFTFTSMSPIIILVSIAVYFLDRKSVV